MKLSLKSMDGSRGTVRGRWYSARMLVYTWRRLHNFSLWAQDAIGEQTSKLEINNEVNRKLPRMIGGYYIVWKKWRSSGWKYQLQTTHTI